MEEKQGQEKAAAPSAAVSNVICCKKPGYIGYVGSCECDCGKGIHAAKPKP